MIKPVLTPEYAEQAPKGYLTDVSGEKVTTGPVIESHFRLKDGRHVTRIDSGQDVEYLIWESTEAHRVQVKSKARFYPESKSSNLLPSDCQRLRIIDRQYLRNVVICLRCQQTYHYTAIRYGHDGSIYYPFCCRCFQIVFEDELKNAE